MQHPNPEGTNTRYCGRDNTVVRLPFEAHFARPGGTISGPTMFQLADIASLIGEVSKLRRSRRQMVCDARIFSAGARNLVAQASCIYALAMTPIT